MTATVRLCRYTQISETNCHDGLDNDCDGLVDMADPSCVYARGGGRGGSGDREEGDFARCRALPAPV